MTYYLIRTLPDGRQETIPFSARGTVDAIRSGKGLHEGRCIAKEAQVRDREGRVICTYLSNEKGLGKSFPTYVQLNLFSET
jgi:hypothetical protein